MALRPTSSSGNAIAERDAAQQEGFLREVDEALREDEFFDILKRYGKPIAAAVVLGLAAFGGYLYWDHASKQATEARSAKAMAALDQLDGGGIEAAAREFDALAKDGSDGSRAVAAMTRAGMDAQMGKADAAAKAFEAVAADSSAPQPLRDLATVRATALKFDSLAPADVVTRLKPLAVPGNPWFGPAGELVGLAYLKQGKPELAGPLLSSIARDKDTSESLRARARQIAAQLGYDAVDDAKKMVGIPNDPAVAQ